MDIQQTFERRIADLVQEFEDTTGSRVRKIEIIPHRNGGYKVRLHHGRKLLDREQEGKTKWQRYETE